MAKTETYMTFRNRLLARELVVGTFIKTPTGHATEILGDLGFDFVVVDQEHAPFDRGDIDAVLLAARAAGTAGIVRVPDASASAILSALDCGAAGVLVPHVASPERARDVVASCRYRGGRRGFANTTRAGEFGGVGFAEHKSRQDAEVCCIAMIEDLDALDQIDRIVQVEGIDAVFIGRGDLTAALDAPSMTSRETHEVVEPIMAAARGAGLPIVMLCPDRKDAAAMHALGASAFVVSSDHGFMRAAAAAALKEFAGPF